MQQKKFWRKAKSKSPHPFDQSRLKNTKKKRIMWLITVILLAWPCDASENDVLDTFMAGSGFGPFFEFSGDRKLRTASSEATVFGMCVSILVARKVVKNHFRNIFNNLI